LFLSSHGASTAARDARPDESRQSAVLRPFLEGRALSYVRAEHAKPIGTKTRRGSITAREADRHVAQGLDVRQSLSKIYFALARFMLAAAKMRPTV
jgi:hypothetical protein